jgi:[acyl-carrier-protein] S-malonyltransferase
MRAAVVFPGQGSQGPAMGSAWVGDPAWHLLEHASAVVGRDLAPALLSPQSAPRHTADVQLCVFLVSMMAWEAVRPLLSAPVVFAGHSFGQISALTAAGVLSFDDGIRLTTFRGEAAAAAGRRQPGGMMAVLGLDYDKATWACSAAPGECWLANDNAPGQVVLAGTEAGLVRAARRALRLGARKLIRLSVEGPFHTPLMLPAAEQFARYLTGLIRWSASSVTQDPGRLTGWASAFSAGSTPVISNADAQPVSRPGSWVTLLADHLISPVRWRATQLCLDRFGVDSLVEVGFGTTLTSLARRTVPGLRRWNVASPAAARELLAAGSA